MRKFMKEFRSELIRAGFATRFAIRGCFDFEIRGVEEQFNIKLPESYTEFLRAMGRRAGAFGQGTDMFYRHLAGNRRAFGEVLKLDGNPFELSPECFVFSSHQGYIFHYFDVTENNPDPPVYGYKEGDLKPKKTADGFSSFLVILLEDLKRGRQ